MTFQQLISICNPVDVYGDQPKQTGGVAQDSRAVEPGDVFVAVKGMHVDGHDFIADAVENGASVIVCANVPASIDGACIVQVDEPRSLIGPLAQASEGNPADQLTVIGVTGTNGKTTIATLVYQILQELGVQASLLGTVEKRINDQAIESRLTTADPVELAKDMHHMVEAGSTHLVMEVSSHALHQQRVAGIDFNVAGFTNLSHDHLDYHADMDEYAAAKKLLFDGLRPEATAVINGDDEYADRMVDNCAAQTVQFTFDPKADGNETVCTIESIRPEGLKLQVGSTAVESTLTGRFNAYNVAQSFLMSRALGHQKDELVRALKAAKGAPGRLERVEGTKPHEQPAVFVDYAHTPAALENVLQTLADFNGEDQTLQVIFGCGGDRDKTKRPEMAAISEQYADCVTVTSDNPRSEVPDDIIDDIMEGFDRVEKVSRITDRKQAIRKTIARAGASTFVLIAGKGHETYQEVKGVRHHFDDREIARQALGCTNGNSRPKEAC